MRHHAGCAPADARLTASSPTEACPCGCRSGARSTGTASFPTWRHGRSRASSVSPGRRTAGRSSSQATPVCSSSFPGGDDSLVLVIHLPHWEGLVHLAARARRIANLDLDLDEPAEHLSGDPLAGPLLRARPGLRPPGTWDPFEAAVRVIIGQQVTIAAASTIAGRLVERFGTPVPGCRNSVSATRSRPHARWPAPISPGSGFREPARRRSARSRVPCPTRRSGSTAVSGSTS